MQFLGKGKNSLLQQIIDYHYVWCGTLEFSAFAVSTLLKLFPEPIKDFKYSSFEMAKVLSSFA
jgi:hypothetical protein